MEQPMTEENTTLRNLLADLIAGARADYEADKFDAAIAACERIKTLCRDHFKPSQFIDELTAEIKADRDAAALKALLWETPKLEDLTW